MTQPIVRTPRNIANPRAVTLQPIDKEALQQALGSDIERQLRRLHVLKWLMDGYVYEGKRQNHREFSEYLGCSPRALDKDMEAVKSKLGFMFKTDERVRNEVSSTAGLLVKICMEDRGRALVELQKVTADIDSIRAQGGVPNPMLLNAQLGFMRQANEAVKGLDKFIDMLSKAATTVHVHGNVNQVQGNQSNSTNVTVFSPMDAIRMMKNQGVEAVVGFKKVIPIDHEFIDVESPEAKGDQSAASA
jgi:hypothetical protein